MTPFGVMLLALYILLLDVADALTYTIVLLAYTMTYGGQLVNKTVLNPSRTSLVLNQGL